MFPVIVCVTILLNSKECVVPWQSIHPDLQSASAIPDNALFTSLAVLDDAARRRDVFGDSPMCRASHNLLPA